MSGITLQSRVRFGWARWAVVCAFFMLPAVADADIVSASNRPMAVDVRIIQLKDGQLTYRLSGGKEISRPIEQIAYLQITGWEDFNRAEKHFRNGNYRQATPLYTQLLTTMSDAEPDADALDRTLLVHCRLLRSCDAQGEFDCAVQSYLHVVEKMPTAVATLQPTRIPAAGSTFLAAAGSKVDEFLSRHPADEPGMAIMRWRSTWPTNASTDTPANQKPEQESGQKLVVPEDPDISAAGTATELANLDRRISDIRKLVESSNADAALKAIEQLHREPLEAIARVRAELFYLQGRALSAQATSSPDESASTIRERAALAFMRVVVHFPEHATAAECLFQVARLEQQAGRAEQAERLRAELVSKYPKSAWATSIGLNPSTTSTTQPHP